MAPLFGEPFLPSALTSLSTGVECPVFHGVIQVLGVHHLEVKVEIG